MKIKHPKIETIDNIYINFIDVEQFDWIAKNAEIYFTSNNKNYIAYAYIARNDSDGSLLFQLLDIKEVWFMFKKFNKKQIFIFSGIILSVILLVFIVIFWINKSKNKIEDTGIKIAEESTSTTSKNEIITVSKTNEEKETELETTTEKEKITTEEEKETTELTVTTTNPTTTAKPTEPVTQPVKEVVTNPPTTVVNNNQYRDPYTGDIISKEEYDSIMNEMNNPEPATTSTPKENIYVLNDDGTLNFKKSKIYNLDDKINNFILESNELKNLLKKDYYNIIYIESHLNSFGMLSFFLDFNDNTDKGFKIEDGNFIELNKIN